MACRRTWLVGVAVLLTSCTEDPEPVVAPPTAPPPAESFTLVATGDVLIHQDRALTAGAEQPDGSYDFSGVLEPVAPLIGAADLAICHLETPVAPRGGPYRGYPSFAVQPEIVDALADAGYDLCSTASNHSLDDGTEGLVRTLDILDAAGIAHAGTYRSEAESLDPTLVDAGGVTVGLVAGTFSLNGVPLPARREWSVDVAPVPDVGGMLAAAGRARAAGAEVVVASLHCCAEYRHDPTDAQVAAVQALLASPDVDLVLGHHAHVVQPIEQIAGEWVAYGLGNHIAEHATRGHRTEDSVAARFAFTRGDDGRFTVTTAEAVPLAIEFGGERVTVQPADPETYARVAEVLARRGGVAAGLQVVAH
ncbi:poly-gamma-glutamate synthesis protein (capsule biosynthesis protein) [Blastococcus colisei]|uniref:Poly-gamma-glutamate synthesis protein (Capsule biosynthesis protein) n=1 Tax=Blastococcus colisei TaxID=1564162 RepID=A0A543PGX6_9ACTN|nr:CapA family protein [Blastococcus colisei]TQN43325.1 poly-gamma-glutamate synthesis protein (capsule biosynthesis protein) [Blastococcus colisei]